MKGDFKCLPKILKKNIICKIGLGLLFLTVFVLMCLFMDHLIFALAPGAFAIFSLMDGIGMTFRCMSGEFVELSGVCIAVYKSKLQRKTKSIVVETKRGTVKLPVRMKMQTIDVGDYVVIYVPDYASVYDYKGEMVVCEFYGIDISSRKEKSDVEQREETR